MIDGPTPAPGAAMDRRIERPKLGRLLIRIAAAAGVLLLAVVGWRLIAASGSTDVASADVETDTVVRAPLEDVLPVRAIAAPAVTTFVGVVAGGPVEELLA